jgi:hypothetical protein
MQNNMQEDIQREMTLFQQNPQQYLFSKGLNIPMDKLQDPQSAVEYIISSGQGTTEQLNQFKTMLGMFRK